MVHRIFCFLPIPLYIYGLQSKFLDQTAPFPDPLALFMRFLFCFIACCLLSGGVSAQVFSADELLGFASYSGKRFESFITKKGFIPSGHFLQSDSVIDTWDMLPKPGDSLSPFVHRRVIRSQRQQVTDYAYQTSSLQEGMEALREMQKNGFVMSDSNWNMQRPLLLQRREWIVLAEKIQEDTLSYLQIRWRQELLPSRQRIRYAEDLLQFHSDEYLAAYFGRDNVRKDQFYFSESEIHKCSVLFPNKPNQVVFVWQDNDAMRDILQVMIGGGIRTENTNGYSGVVDGNGWRLQNGLRTHMRVEQIMESAGKDLQFFGRPNPLYLSLTPESSRALGLQNMALVLECINGAGAELLDQEIVSVQAAIDQGLRLHVGMIVLWVGE